MPYRQKITLAIFPSIMEDVFRDVQLLQSFTLAIFWLS